MEDFGDTNPKFGGPPPSRGGSIYWYFEKKCTFFSFTREKNRQKTHFFRFWLRNTFAKILIALGFFIFTKILFKIRRDTQLQFPEKALF